jgi:hypothetical protein
MLDAADHRFAVRPAALPKLRPIVSCGNLALPRGRSAGTCSGAGLRRRRHRAIRCGRVKLGWPLARSMRLTLLLQLLSLQP